MILNVENDAPSRFLRSRILERAGLTAREASSAEEALAWDLPRPPKLLLLDVALPDGDGFTVCERFKEAHPDVPIVMISAVYQNSVSRREGFAAGADEYLLSPVDPAPLAERSRALLGLLARQSRRRVRPSSRTKVVESSTPALLLRAC